MDKQQFVFYLDGKAVKTHLHNQCHLKHNEEYIDKHVDYLSQHAIHVDQHINFDATTVYNRVETNTTQTCRAAQVRAVPRSTPSIATHARNSIADRREIPQSLSRMWKSKKTRKQDKGPEDF
ncbi:hypothetical protein BJ322DRAFT_1017808 [Thelephora terrestris]|uniref:Uncharacterized protein n=1 Tax=Thelephora terrestris TaxID=56493 RepID=A0A9P6HP11_9AGAM|nr:hypothetical protein BJ322DRAFT_1017808 [Thelephora terrestris]